MCDSTNAIGLCTTAAVTPLCGRARLGGDWLANPIRLLSHLGPRMPKSHRRDIPLRLEQFAVRGIQNKYERRP